MTISLGSRIKELRESAGFLQEQLAQMLEVSRPTLTQIENDNRQVKAGELKKLSEIFDTTVDFLLSGKSDNAIHPTSDQEGKFKKLLLYILSKVGAKYNVGKVVLYKLLYFSEFDFFELYDKHISGYPFIKLPMGPAPLYFDLVVNKMKDANELITIVAEYGNFYQQRYVPNVKVDKIVFTKEELDCIDGVLDKYSDYGANEISELSHSDKPRQIAKEMEIISYDLVKFREYPFSRLAINERKDKALANMKSNGSFDDLYHEPDLYNDY